jgi:hypothetical protein
MSASGAPEPTVRPSAKSAAGSTYVHRRKFVHPGLCDGRIDVVPVQPSAREKSEVGGGAAD